MAEKEKLLRALPQVDALLREPELGKFPRAAAAHAVRAELDALREGILCGCIGAVPPRGQISRAVERRLRAQEDAPRPLINATGVALHTNLGRAPLAPEAVQAVCRAAQQYCALEYCLETGQRGSRGDHLEPLLCALTGCEAALVVNNNAAALLLALSALAGEREVLLSRGELVEIGDGFRIPEILARSGARLVEVGATNKTHLRDYEQAIGPQTGLLLKVHTSNFKMVGFAQSVPLQRLAELGRAHHIPTVYDLGSGAVLPEDSFFGEPTAAGALRHGADLVCFSGDKLLGGPQAGILVGRRELIDRMRQDPLARALRLDKLSLAALAATLRLYQSPETVRERVPVLRMLCTDPALLHARALRLCALLSGAKAELEVVPSLRPAGGGSLPGQELEGFAVAVAPRGFSAARLEEKLRTGNPPVIARIAGGRLLLDPAAMEDGELAAAAKRVCEVCADE